MRRPAPHDLSLKTIEREHIRRMLVEMGGNTRGAARVLGVSRSTLDRKLVSARLSLYGFCARGEERRQGPG